MNQQTSPQSRISTNLEKMFASAKRRNLNNTGVVIDFAQNIWAGSEVWDSSPTEFSLYVEHDDPDFIRIMESGNIAEMKVFTTPELWLEYSNGNGYVLAAIDYDAGLGLSFQVVEGVTIIEGYQIPYRCEVQEVWDNVTPFRKYVQNNIRGIYLAAEKKAELRKIKVSK